MSFFFFFLHSHRKVWFEVGACLWDCECRWEEGGSRDEPSAGSQSEGHSTALYSASHCPLHYQHQLMATTPQTAPQIKESLCLHWDRIDLPIDCFVGGCWGSYGFKARWLLIPKSCSTTQLVRVKRGIAKVLSIQPCLRKRYQAF